MKSSSLLTVVCILCLANSGVSRADWFDNFDDGDYTGDANGWDIDNPPWTLYAPLGSPYAATVDDGWLRLWTVGEGYLGFFALLIAYVDDGGRDPNTSHTYWDDSTSHYILVRAKNFCEEANPNRGRVTLFMNANEDTWEGGYELTYEFYKYGSSTLFGMACVTGLWWCSMTGHHFPPLDEPNGFWILFQFYSDGKAGDPNNKYLQATCWDGDKFDWDGTWIDNVHLADSNQFEDPNAALYYGSMGGRIAIASYGDTYWHAPDGYPSDVGFDHIEVRTGVFSNVARRFRLEVSHANYGTVTLDPNLPDPADPNLRRYTDGTNIVLTATPISGKLFREWSIWSDPNTYHDANYATRDSNAVLHLTMDRDYLVEADFKCGSGLVPMLAIGLLALTLTAAARRFR